MLSAQPTYRYFNGNFPCLVTGGEALEDPQDAVNAAMLYRINARNGLRHLTYGTPLFKGSLLRWSNLKLLWLNANSLFIKRDAEHLKALRTELCAILENAYLICEQCDPETQDVLENFINTLLSNLPFLDPQEGQQIRVPQRIQGRWQLLPYRVEKIDISPQSGWRAPFLNDENRIYAYGLVPLHAAAKPYLLLMGTTYFTGQGFELALRGDFNAGQSVGELHDLTELERWMTAHQHVILSGHSQGGSMAMIVAAKYPEHTHQAFCLNPTGLHRDTLTSLHARLAQPNTPQPNINVYTQDGDPVFIYGHGFIKGSNIYLVEHPEANKKSYFGAHAHHFLGHHGASYRRIDEDEQAIHTVRREFANDIKHLADVLLGFLLDLNFIYMSCKHTVTELYHRHSGLFSALLFFAVLATCVALTATGVLTPAILALIVPGFKLLTPMLAYSAITTASLLLSILAIYVVPLAISISNKLLYGTCAALTGMGLGVAFSVGFLVTAGKTLKRVCTGEAEVGKVRGLSDEPFHTVALRPSQGERGRRSSTGDLFERLGEPVQDTLKEQEEGTALGSLVAPPAVTTAQEDHIPSMGTLNKLAMK